jgi:hypothetical protein
MGFNKFYALGMIGIYFRIEEYFPERGDLKFFAHILVEWARSLIVQ